MHKTALSSFRERRSLPQVGVISCTLPVLIRYVAKMAAQAVMVLPASSVRKSPLIVRPHRAGRVYYQLSRRLLLKVADLRFRGPLAQLPMRLICSCHALKESVRHADD